MRTILIALLAASLQAAAPVRTIYIVPSSHYDRGFVVPPDQVPAMAARHLDEVIQAADANPNFRWTIESVWQVLAFLDRERGLGDIFPGRPERVQELMQLIRGGRVDLSAAWGSTHTEFLGAEELNRLTLDFAALRRAYGIRSELAVLNDVPGQPWPLASVLSGSGVRYLLVGANQFVGGGTSLAPGNVPFYWQGPDGAKVLTWVSQSPRGGYTEGITDFFLDPFTNDPYMQASAWKIFNPKSAEKSPLEIMQAGMDVFLKRLSDAGYRYDAALVMHVHDFLHPSTVASLEKAVALWNGAHRTPELRIATATEFFRYMEEKYGATIPTMRGEWAGLWSEAKTSSPRISALARRAHEETPAAETLWSALAMADGVPFPAGDFSALYHRMLGYDEHSGAGNVGWPGLNDRDQLEEQNREYAASMRAAVERTGYLLQAGIGLAGGTENGKPGGHWTLAVWNALSWARTDVAEVAPPETGWHITAIHDRRTGAAVPFDVDAQGQGIFVAREVPSMGYATFEIDASPGAAVSTLSPASAAANRTYQVTADPSGNIRSMVDLRDRRELVNSRAAAPFNYLLRGIGDQPAPVAVPFAPAIRIARGRVMTEMTVERTGSAFASTRIRLFDGIDRVEILNRLDGARLPFATMNNGFDSYYFCFPFALDPGTLVVHPEEQQGFISLPGDYLPGARRDAVTSQHAIALSDARATVVLAHRQAFHFVFPGFVRTEPTRERPAFPAMLTGKWPLPEATLYSRAMRQSNQGEMRGTGVSSFSTVEPGIDEPYEFDYAVGSAAGALDAVAAARFGAAFDVPLRAVYVPFAAAAERSFFTVDRPNVRIDTVKQAEGGGSSDITPTNLTGAAPVRRYVMRLREIAGTSGTRVTVSLPGQPAKAEITDLAEDRVLGTVPVAPAITLSLKPYETVTLRLEMKDTP